jgi:hypothetical protein
MFTWLKQLFLSTIGWEPCLSEVEKQKMENVPEGGLLLLYPETSFWDSFLIWLTVSQLDVNLYFITSPKSWLSRFFGAYKFLDYDFVSTKFIGQNQTSIYLMSENLYEEYGQLEFISEHLSTKRVGVIGANFHPKVKCVHMAHFGKNMSTPELVEYGLQQYFPLNVDRKIVTTPVMRSKGISYKAMFKNRCMPYAVDMYGVLSLFVTLFFEYQMIVDFRLGTVVKFLEMCSMFILNISREKFWTEYLMVLYCIAPLMINRILNIAFTGEEIFYGVQVSIFFCLMAICDVENITTQKSYDGMVVRTTLFALFSIINL